MRCLFLFLYLAPFTQPILPGMLFQNKNLFLLSGSCVVALCVWTPPLLNLLITRLTLWLSLSFGSSEWSCNKHGGHISLHTDFTSSGCVPRSGIILRGGHMLVLFLMFWTVSTLSCIETMLIYSAPNSKDSVSSSSLLTLVIFETVIWMKAENSCILAAHCLMSLTQGPGWSDTQRQLREGIIS